MADIETPCNKVCSIDPSHGLCIGCGRSGAEIAGWIGFTVDQRRAIMAALPQRLALMQRGAFTSADSA